MRRRDFCQMVGAGLLAGPPEPSSTVLFEDHAVTITRTLADPANNKDVLWVRKADLPRINGFEVKPQGACRSDVCIPVPRDMTHGEYFNLSAFARQLSQSVVVDRDSRVWSFGEIPALRGGFLESRIAPDFAVPDRKGRIVHLSEFRGRKVLIVTWASW